MNAPLKPNAAPVNMTIFRPTVQTTGHLRPVTTLDLHEPSTTSFHPDGLFSITTFGRVGSKERDTMFSVIDIRVEIIHPYLYKTLVSMKSLYESIMQGKTYAKWDPVENDLVESNPLDGDTGYQFFMEHLPIIKFKLSESEERRRKIKLIEKAIKENKMVTSRILVMPAGYRDIEVDKDQRIVDNEINDFYRSLIGVSNSIIGTNDLTSQVFDVSRNSLQRSFNALFDYLYTMLKGKTGIIEAKWARRSIVDGTRNVITSIVSPVGKLGSGDALTLNHCAFGLYQTMKGCMPLAIHCIMHGWLRDSFENGVHAKLVNPKTLNAELVSIGYDEYDRWTTEEGVTKLIDEYENKDLRSLPIMIEGKYLGLVYRGPDMSFKFFRDINELPKELSKEYVFPITTVELFYLSCYKRLNATGVFATRFPWNGIRSTVPMIPRIITTPISEKRYPMDDQWKIIQDQSEMATSYPTFKNNDHFDSMAPHFATLAGHGADFDGDKESAGFIYSDDAVEELHAKLSEPSTYKAADGGLLASSMIDPVEMVFFNMTKAMKPKGV